MLTLFNIDKNKTKHQENIIPETLLLVFTFLNQKDLTTISVVSKYFNNLSSSNLIWKVYSSKLKNWHPISENLSNEKYDYKNYVFSYNQFFQYQKKYEVTIPKIKILCLGQAKPNINDLKILSKDLILAEINPNTKKNNNEITFEFGPKKHQLQFWTIPLQHGVIVKCCVREIFH
jgi:hypothetical protein